MPPRRTPAFLALGAGACRGSQVHEGGFEFSMIYSFAVGMCGASLLSAGVPRSLPTKDQIL